MPMYDEYCPKCNVMWEVLVSLDELDNDIKCPDCGGKLERQLCAPYFKVK